MSNKILIHLAWVTILLFSFCAITTSNVSANNIQGEGTKENPFLINDAKDLLDFANAVNSGTTFENQYVLQTSDIDLDGIDWMTIGPYDSEFSFMGTYDGNGHIIENLTVTEGGNNAFFGKLGGIVMNLGIDSGLISGTCVGGITSQYIIGFLRMYIDKYLVYFLILVLLVLVLIIVYNSSYKASGVKDNIE